MAQHLDHDVTPDGEREREMIPGELDPTTEAPTEPAIVGSTGFGADAPQDQGAQIDDETKKRFEWEGGGRRG